MLFNHAGGIGCAQFLAAIAVARIVAQLPFHFVQLVEQVAILAPDIDDSELLACEVASVATNQDVMKYICFHINSSRVLRLDI